MLKATAQRTLRKPTTSYYVVAWVLVIFGFLGAMTIGGPFLLFGITMLLLAPLVRRGSYLVAPILCGLGAFLIILLLVAPAHCSITMGSVSRRGPDSTISTSSSPEPTCESLIGVRPDALPANAAAIAAIGGTGLGLGVFFLARRHSA